MKAVVVGLAVLAVLAAAFLINLRIEHAAASRLPSMPALTGRSPLLVAQIQSADALARKLPTNPATVGPLGMAYHSNLLYAEALAAYRLASELDTRDWRWPYYEALVHAERNETDEATLTLKIVINVRPDSGLAWWRLGEVAFKQTRYEEADAAYARAEAGLSSFARVGRARVALNRGDAAAAITILTPLVEEAPRFGLAQRVLAEALRAQGRNDDAASHRERGNALGAYAAPSDPAIDALADISRSAIFLLKQAAALDLGQPGGRREQLVRRALESEPDNPDVVYELGSLLQLRRRPAEALPYFLRHLEMVSDDQQTLVQIGKVYSDLGRLEEAEASLRKALANADDAVGFYNLGVVLEQRDRLPDAEASYRRAIALGPGLASARNNLGGLLAAGGRLREAIPLFLEAIRLDPTRPDAYANLAGAKIQSGEVEEAVRLLEAALRIDPRHAGARANLDALNAMKQNR